MALNKSFIIINPASAGGKTGDKLQKLKRIIEEQFTADYVLAITSQSLDATYKTRKAIKDGFTTIVAVGGDGTIQEVVNGFFEHGKLINRQVKLGIINSGTGCGLAQSLNVPDKIKDQFHNINRGYTHWIDIGKAMFHNGKNSPETRYFVNELQLGIGGTVVKKLQTKQKRLGGFLAFGLTVVKTIFTQPNQDITINLDSRLSLKQKYLGILVANGAYTGGGMNLAPLAKLNDRYLDILFMHGQSIAQRLKNFPMIYFGKHIELPQFSYYQARKIKINSSENVLIEADGELLGYPPCTVEILPAAIQIFGSSNSPHPLPHDVWRAESNILIED